MEYFTTSTNYFICGENDAFTAVFQAKINGVAVVAGISRKTMERTLGI